MMEKGKRKELIRIDSDDDADLMSKRFKTELLKEVREMQKDLNTVLTISKGMKLPPGLFKSISDTFKCHICHSIPMRRVSASSLSTPADAARLYRERTEVI